MSSTLVMIWKKQGGFGSDDRTVIYVDTVAYIQ